MIFSKSKRINSGLYNASIFTYEDIILHVPYKYLDYSLSNESISFLDKQKIVLEGKIISSISISNVNKISIVSFDFLSINNKFYRVVAFNRDYLAKVLNVNELITIMGVYNKNKNQINLTNFNKGKIDDDQLIKPIYHLPSSIKNFEFSRLVKKAFESIEKPINTIIPFSFLNKHNLINKMDALKLVHFPRNKEELKKGLLFLKYEEAFLFSLKNQLSKNLFFSQEKLKLEPIDILNLDSYISSLPFKLTLEQRSILKEICFDMNSNKEMYRLLEGDVGSGKTIIAFLSLILNFLRNKQGVLLAPTEILAKQHYDLFMSLFTNFKINVKLLTGNTPNEEKNIILDDLKDGLIDILIGTHSIFSKSVKYNNLSLVVIDEQHRFGVNQRNDLIKKGRSVDVLMLSATPIPRSLALTIYGDLDISILPTIKERKRKVQTIMEMDNDKTCFKYIDEALKLQKKIYIVCPLIEFEEKKNYSLDGVFPRYFNKYNGLVAALHGKMKSEEKIKILENFKNGTKPILISTQVIEVGIDVSDAELIIIYKASKFGLASLHQLRGRVGRDFTPAKCVLLYDKDDDFDALNRLKQLELIDDGFKLSELDLSNRGPGELLGLKQSGLPDFKYLNISKDIQIFKVAQNDIKELIDNFKNNKSYSFTIEYLKKQILNECIKKA